MTSPVYIRSVFSPRWCRLVIIGAEHHGTACISGSILVTDPVMLSSDPPADEVCCACRRDLTAKQARVPTVELRPRVWRGEVADIDTDLAIPRVPTGDW